MTALHVMTSDRFPKEAYIEWAATVGALQKTARCPGPRRAPAVGRHPDP